MTIRNSSVPANYQQSSPVSGGVMMSMDYEVLTQRMQQLQRFVKEYMTPGEDYGTIEGINKPTLLKSGAEKLCDVYGLSAGEPVIDYVRDGNQSPTYISYRIVMPLISRADGRVIMTGVGSCNSHEKKYKWRWIFDNELPTGVNPQGLKSRKVGKNQQYVQYQVPNDEVDDLDNTILKMAKKRALIDAVLSATRSSAMFTQDIEDMDIKPQNNDQRYEQRQNNNRNSNNNYNKGGQNNNSSNRNQNNNSGKSTENQIKAIFASARSKGLESDEVKALTKNVHKVESMNDLTYQQASDMISLINQTDGPSLKGMIGTPNNQNQNNYEDPFANDGQPINVSDDDLPF